MYSALKRDAAELAAKTRTEAVIGSPFYFVITTGHVPRRSGRTNISWTQRLKRVRQTQSND
eukprot:6209593-Pleurochrysis_carterae.AAC.3